MSRLEDFYLDLEGTGGWELEGGWGSGRLPIRHRPSNHCPLSFVAAQRGLKADPLDPGASGRSLGLRRRESYRIAAAADEKGHHPRIRARLLKACGLGD